jgi:hypothetical protein
LHSWETTNNDRNIYPERLDYIDQVLTSANQKVAEYQNSADLHSQATQSQILSLLLSPIKTYISLFTALALPNFIPLLHSQPYPTRRAVAGEVARSLMRNQTPITSVENLESVLEILKVLIREGIQQAQGYPGGPIQRRAQETEETIEEQGWLARIVHLIRGKDNDTQFKVSRIMSLHRHILTLDSSSKLHANPLLRATSASSTLHLLLSRHRSNLHASTRSENTSKTTGNHSPPPSTSSCTIPCRLSTAASRALQIYRSASSSLVVKSLTKMASRKLRTNTSHRLSLSTRRRSATRGRSSRLYASSRVGCIQQGTLERKTTTH